jgi:dihydrofolate reductase
MGKSTWDSLPRKPLPNRENLIVTTSKQEFGYDDYEFINFSDLEVKLSSTKDINNIWIIGGAKLISGLINFIEEFHLSRINGNFNCDTFLPSDLIKEKFILSKTDVSDGVNFDIWCKK